MSKITLLAIDLAKSVFQICGVDEHGQVQLERRVRRAQLVAVLVQLPRCTIAMEACGSAHYWGRRLRELGYAVRLLAPQHVKVFNRGQKNDRNDAQAIACAARQPGIPQVALKSEEQQAVLALHRLRERVVRERVARVNQLHGLMGEFGIVLPIGLSRLRQVLRERLDNDDLPALLVPELRLQLEYLEQLCQQQDRLTERLKQLAEASESCQALMRARGVGPILATAFVSEIGDASLFRNGRQVGAWLGLVPRQYCSADRRRLLGITKRGNPYLRKLLVHGARAAMRVAPRYPDPISRWAQRVRERRGANRAAVALANKLARRLWASLRYAQPAVG